MSRPQEGKEEAISRDRDVERRGARQPSSPNNVRKAPTHAQGRGRTG